MFEVRAISIVGGRKIVSIFPTTTVAELKQKLAPAQSLKVIVNGKALRDGWTRVPDVPCGRFLRAHGFELHLAILY